MITEFYLENYKSIAGRIQVDLRGIVRKNESENNFPGYKSAKWKVRILPVLAIFGQNGAGKSNILSGLFDLILLLSRGNLEAPAENKNPHYFESLQPFAFDSKSQNNPTVMGITFLVKEVVYEYHVAILSKKIQSERLSIALPNSKRSLLIFDRHAQAESRSDVWRWGDRRRFPFIKQLVALSHNLKRQRLFLPLAWSTYEIPLLAGLKRYLDFIPPEITPANVEWHRQATIDRVARHPSFAKAVSGLLRLFDVGISSVEVKNKQLISYHPRVGGGYSQIKFDMESEGTRQLFDMSAAILSSLKRGTLLIVDELDSHLHPLVSQAIVALYQSPSTNKNNAQIMFTTHDTTILNQNVLRREQIYLANRDMAGRTSAEAVSEYGVRKDLVLARSYLQGRLSGLPRLKDERDFGLAVTGILKILP